MNGLDNYIVFIIWNLCGFIMISCYFGLIGRAKYIRGYNFVNPFWVYKHFTKLNIFGTFWVTLLFNVACPIGTVIYWFSKMCTVGRKQPN